MSERPENNEQVLERCLAVMREHDKHAEAIGFSRCGCEYCKVVRFYEPPHLCPVERLEVEG